MSELKGECSTMEQQNQIPQTMKAVVFKGIDQLQLEEVPTPQISEDDILIRIDSCSICGSDVRIISNGYHRVPPGTIMGHEIAGTVVKIGDNQKNKFSFGQRICLGADIPCGHCTWCQTGSSNNCKNTIAYGHEYPGGGFAQYMKLDKRSIDFGPLVLLPHNDLSQDEFALTEPLACCVNGLEYCNMSIGKTILIFGAGPLGILMAKLARTMGASFITLCDIDQDRLNAATISEADQIVPSTDEALKKIVDKHTQGEGFDVVITACPTMKAQEQSIHYTKNRGVINFFGGLPQTAGNLSFPSNILHYKEITLLGSHGSTPRHNQIAAEMILHKKIYVKDLLSQTVPLEQLPKAIQDLKTDKTNLKITVRPWG